MNAKKILIVIGILILAGAGGYFAFQKIAAPTTTGTGNPSTSFLPESDQQTSQSSTSQLATLSDIPVLDFWIDRGDKTIYFISTDNSIYALPAGQTTSPEKMHDLSSDPLLLTPSAEGSAALIQTKGLTDNLFSVINPSMGSQIFLPLGTGAATWGTTNKEVIYLSDKKFNSRTPAGLYRFTLATKRSTFIGPLDITDVTLNLISADELVVQQKSSAGVSSEMFVYNLKKKTLMQYGASGTGLSVRWAPSGAKAIINSFAPNSNLSYLSQGKTITLSAQTMPEKCTFFTTSLLCGVPKTPLNNSNWALPDDYYLGKLLTDDTLFQINPETNLTTSIYAPVESIDMFKPLYDAGTLYFINRHDNKLYSLALD